MTPTELHERKNMDQQEELFPSTHDEPGELEVHAALQETQPALVVTEDMRLPDGSTVIQCILHRDESGKAGHLDFRCITVGATEFDPTNPAHRFLNAVADRIEEIMAEVTGGTAEFLPEENDGTIEQRLLATQPVDAAPCSSELI